MTWSAIVDWIPYLLHTSLAETSRWPAISRHFTPNSAIFDEWVLLAIGIFSTHLGSWKVYCNTGNVKQLVLWDQEYSYRKSSSSLTWFNNSYVAWVQDFLTSTLRKLLKRTFCDDETILYFCTVQYGSMVPYYVTTWLWNIWNVTMEHMKCVQNGKGTKFLIWLFRFF